jgi:phenylpropionate dioxygenase-like ring-hydroxylating dioxygenase large terminal subunit
MIDDPILLHDWHVVASADGVHAWHGLCLHRGARLSGGRVANDCLACPYHGWEYNGAGRCVRTPALPDQPPPAKAQTTVYAVQEKYGLVWVCLGAPARGVPDSFLRVSAGPYLFRAHGPRVIENFLDVAHFPSFFPLAVGKFVGSTFSQRHSEFNNGSADWGAD